MVAVVIVRMLAPGVIDRGGGTVVFHRAARAISRWCRHGLTSLFSSGVTTSPLVVIIVVTAMLDLGVTDRGVVATVPLRAREFVASSDKVSLQIWRAGGLTVMFWLDPGGGGGGGFL